MQDAYFPIDSTGVSCSSCVHTCQDRRQLAESDNKQGWNVSTEPWTNSQQHSLQASRMDICLVQGLGIRGGDSRIAEAHAPSPSSADISKDKVASLRGWDLAAAPTKSPAADWFVEAPLRLSEYANTEASNSHGAAAPNPSRVTAPVVSAPPPSSPAAMVAPPPAHKRMCSHPPMCTWSTDKEGNTFPVCKPQPDTPSNRANLCLGDLDGSTIAAIVVGGTLIGCSIGGFIWACMLMRKQKKEAARLVREDQARNEP